MYKMCTLLMMVKIDKSMYCIQEKSVGKSFAVFHSTKNVFL